MSDPVCKTICIQIDRSDDGVWDYWLSYDGEPVVMGNRPTQQEAYDAACQKLKELEDDQQ
jgi:hypothetical protein